MAPPVVAFTLVFGAGLWAGFVVLVPPWVIPVALPLALLAIAGRGWRGTLVAAGVAGLAVGTHHGERARDACARRWTPGPQAAFIRLGDAPDARGRARGTVRHAAAGCGGPLRLRVSVDGPLPSGVTMIAVGTWHRTRTFEIVHYRVLPVRPSWRHRARDALAKRITRLYGPRAPVAAALVLGRRGDLDPALRQRFADAGLAHLLAISGLHVGMLAGWMALAFAATGLRRSAPAWAAVGTWAYVALLGFPAPATRAAGFVTVWAVARGRQRRPPPGAVLSTAVLIILLLDPAAVVSLGAWLSVAAVWGTGVASRVGRPPRTAVTRLWRASLGATAATAPITAFAFGAVAPAGLLANLVAVPLAGLAVPGVFLSLVGGAVPAAGSGAVLTVLERVAEFAAALPGGQVRGTPGWRFAVPWLVLLAGAYALLRVRGGWRRSRRAATAVALGVWAWVLLGVVRARASGELEIHMLDVGQGDAIVVRTPAGRWMLVDAGPRSRTHDAGRRVVVPFLRRHGVRRLEAVVVSHGDADHLGGVPAVLAAVDVGRILEPGQPLGTGLYGEFLAQAAARGAVWTPARTGDLLTVDGVRLEVLHPAPDWAASELRPNENSLVIHLAYRAFDLLLTGDIGWPAESVLVRELPRVEVLKVAHHGSAGGTRAAFLDRVGPRVALISAGRRNPYGHPAPDVLRRLADRGVVVRRTDRDGTVTLKSDGRYFALGRPPVRSLFARIACHVRQWSRSKASSSSRNVCTRTPPGSSRISFTTWPSPARSSPATSAARD